MLASAESRHPSTPPRSALLSGSFKIMVVVDDKLLRELLHRHLSRAGYEVWSAETGIEANRMVQRSAPDLMIVDAGMPCMNGFELVSTIRANKAIAFFPVIFLAAQIDVAALARELGAACLFKPVNCDLLLAAVASSLRTPRQRPAAGRAGVSPVAIEELRARGVSRAASLQ